MDNIVCTVDQMIQFETLTLETPILYDVFKETRGTNRKSVNLYCMCDRLILHANCRLHKLKIATIYIHRNKETDSHIVESWGL